MLRGYLDNVTSLGYMEGWACDTADPTLPLEVGVVWNDTEVAWGLAHRFREDLMNADFGIGWSAFRLRLEVSLEEIQFGPVRLLARASGAELFAMTEIAVIEDGEKPMATLEALVGSDPTVIGGIWQLRKCEQLMMQFIRRQGVESFLDAAYAYVLGRPADPPGRAQFTRSIRQGTSTPVGVLEALEDTDEYRAGSRLLTAPNSPGFPFV
jgi:hypothetical protein